MADDYYGSGRRKSDKASRSLLGRLFDGVMVFVTVIAAIAALLTYIAPYVNPASAWIFSILGLAAPAIYLTVVLIALYWIIRWRWTFASVMLVLLFIGLFNISLFYKPEFKRVYEGSVHTERGLMKFLSYNVRNFYDDRGQSSAEEVMRLIGDAEPDIICMQEFNPTLADSEPAYDAFREKYPYSAGGRSDDTVSSTMAVFSKYKILRWGPSRESVPQDGFRESIWADLLVGSDTIRVFNNHLHSTTINADDNEFITKHKYISDTARDVKIRSIVRRLRDNNILRAEQVDSIALTIGETPYARIVCGDFNDTPMSYVYRKMAHGLNDAFREAGVGYSHTFRGFFNTLRIDYVLSSDDFEIRSYEVLDADYSDHRPILVRLRYTPRN